MNVKLYIKICILSSISQFYILINEEIDIINYYIIDSIKLKKLVYEKGYLFKWLFIQMAI